MQNTAERNKWKVNRAGLFNYWYYEDQAFDFAGGKLLLRGNNGAGKSVTMQSFLPVLLDGSTRPERLDPFNSKARRMEDYLLGEKEVSGHDERTGYLYMEFKRQQTEQYMTIGIGLQAKRGRQLKFWGFILTDNRRIGHDFPLYKMENHDGEQVKIPLSRIQLRNQVANGGYVVDKRKDYASLVNEYIFGYETIEQYEDLIKLLIQLRSPKLSKDYKPSAIYEILEEALPPLSDEDLRHLSDTIEQMDQTKQQLDQLEREYTAITDLNKVYTAYNEKILYDQTMGYLEAEKRKQDTEQRYQTAVDKAKHHEDSLACLAQTINLQHIDLETARKTRHRLEHHEVWNLEEERQDNEKRLEEEENIKEQTEQKVDKVRKKIHTEQSGLDDMELKINQRQERIEDLLEELEADALEASFIEADRMHQEDFQENKQNPFSFSAWNRQARNQLKHLEEIKESLRKLEMLQKQYQEKDQELGQYKQTMDELRNSEKDWEQWFKEEKNQQLNKIHEWIKTADYLMVSDEQIQEASRALDRLYEETRYDQVREPIQAALNAYKSGKQKNLAILRVHQDRTNKIIEELEQEATEWKNKKDPDPDTHPKTKEMREQWKQQGIQVEPLYNVVEFRETVDEETKKRIEAALIETGLLDAVVSEEEVMVEYDRILRPNPQLMAYTLSEFLQPDVSETSVTAEFVEQILQSILIDESDEQVLSISEKGHYSIGLLKGHAVPVETVRFIGKNVRKRYREEQIRLLEEQIQSEKQELEKIETDIERNESSIRQADHDFKEFPNDENLFGLYDKLEKARFNINQLNDTIQRLSEAVKRIGKEVRELELSIKAQTKENRLNLTVQEYVTAADHMHEYERMLSELKREQEHFLNEEERKQETINRLEDLEEEILELKGDFNVVQDRITRLEKNIEQIERQMDQAGVKDIRDQIQSVIEEIEKLTEEIERNKVSHTEHRVDLTHVEKDIEDLETERTFFAQLVKAWRKSYVNEMKRALVTFDDDESTEMLEASEVLKALSGRVSTKETAQLTSQLSRVRNDRQDDLIEYSPLQRSLFQETEHWMQEVEGGEKQLLINQWKQAGSREIIELTAQGKRVSPYLVGEDLKQERERQSVMLDEQDKKLYEEILFHSVGMKLRARIDRAERWVEEMRKLMESRNDSSGVEFSIRWRPRTAETEEEMDTKDLVELLRQNPRALKDEAIDQVTKHFRTKINRAKVLMNESTEMQTLLQVLKQVLDYRRWFSFELSVKRTGDERRKPLTNTQFDKFSGGEKARAMYIPLFIATYSRYLEAGDEAPYLISLDEAFAGVDERNIADLFEVVEELGFNYIMNSQAIWGDYETVSKLAISELFRPQNADHVVVIRYLWDGQKRVMVNDEISES
ncbi:TIGR02680 family protein [Marinilactibacillus psychrotolerans]|uniref:TIGR02680 family protein n=1 Tax=Marinilactibacillus psychrotolerans TaxID=191770 RepID=UPI00388551A4